MTISRNSLTVTLATALLLLALLALVPISAANAQGETPAEAQWYATYWNNTELSGIPVLERNESSLDYDWGFGSPAPEVAANRFSARWTSRVYFDAGTYRFTTTSDDGIRVWLDDEHIINNWSVHPAAVDSTVVTLEAGEHDLAVDYFEQTGRAVAMIEWERIDIAGDERVTISPRVGPVGTPVEIAAQGFAPGAEVTVGLGRTNAEPTLSRTFVADQAGNVDTTLTIPEEAEPGEAWVVLVRHVAGEGTVERALSDTFSVTAGEVGGNICGDQYTVQPGDWLARIARRCGTSVDAILTVNPAIDDPSLVQPGQTINLPSTDDASRVTLSPAFGTAGTTVDVTAVGLAPDISYTVGLGRQNAEPATSVEVTPNEAGTLETVMTIPASADVGAPWVVVIIGGGETLYSNTFLVTGGEGGGEGGLPISATTLYNLNLRSGPAVGNEILDVIPADTGVPILARNGDSSWLQVEYGGTVGWVAARFAEVAGDLEDVPVVFPG